MSFCEVSKRLVLRPSGIVEISVPERRAQVRTEVILVGHRVVSQSLKELSLLELSLH